MGFIFPLLYFSLGAFAFSSIFRVSVFRSFPAFMIFAVLVLYISGLLFSDFSFGLLGINVCLLIYLGYSFFSAFFQSKRVEKESNTDGQSVLCAVLIFCLLYTFVYIIDYKRSFSMWDEWSHWGVMAKELLRLNDFYLNDSSVLTVHRDYPPFLSILEYLYVRVSCSSGFSEAYLFRSVHLFVFSLLMIPLEKIHCKIDPISSLVFIVFPISLVCVLSFGPCGQETLLSLYNDLPLAALVATALYIALESDNFDFSTTTLLTLILSAILLTKQIGIAFFCLTIFALALRLVFLQFKSTSKGDAINCGYKAIAVIVFPLFLSFLWKKRVSISTADQQFDLSKISLSDASNGVLTGSFAEPYRTETLTHFIHSCLNNSFVTYPVSLSYFSCAFILILLICIAIYFGYRGNHIGYARRILVTCSVFVAGFIGYTVSMLLLYLFCFDAYEAVNLASFNRYLGTFLSIEMIYFFMISVDFALRLDKSGIRPSNSMLFIPFCVFIVLTSTNTLQSALSSNAASSVSPAQGIAEQLSNYLSADDSLYLVDQDGDGGTLFQIAYYLNPCKTNTNSAFRFGKTSDSIYNVDCRDQSLGTYIAEYKYLFVHNMNDDFCSRFSSLLNSGDIFVDNGLYVIKHTDGKFRLTLVAVIH